MSNNEVNKQRGFGTQNVYATLRQEILSLTLEPGSPLDEMRLSERFGMSRTPIREALLRLASDSLVTTLPNRNTIVSTIDFASLPTYFDALTLMYRVTTRGAAERSKNGVVSLEALKQQQKHFANAVEAHDAFAMIEANRDFHVEIANIHGNSYYIAFFSRLLDEGRRISRLYYSSYDDHLPQQYVEEHEQIIQAIETGDVELADNLASDHAFQLARQIQDYIARDMQSALSIKIN